MWPTTEINKGFFQESLFVKELVRKTELLGHYYGGEGSEVPGT